jgi:PTS system cellobiose-specific IIB component
MMPGDTSEPKPIKVLMVCAMGMSSSLLEIKTKEAAAKAGMAFELKAVGVQEITSWDPTSHWYDIILVAPQVFYKRKAIQMVAERHGILVQAIEPTIFGMVDGEALFKQIMAALKTRDASKDMKESKAKESKALNESKETKDSKDKKDKK